MVRLFMTIHMSLIVVGVVRTVPKSSINLVKDGSSITDICINYDFGMVDHSNL